MAKIWFRVRARVYGFEKEGLEPMACSLGLSLLDYACKPGVGLGGGVRYSSVFPTVFVRFSARSKFTLNPLLPESLKTPPFFSFSANGQNFKNSSQTRAEWKRPLARVDQGNDSKTCKSFGCLAGMETLFSSSKNEAQPIGLWPVLQHNMLRRDGV